MQITTTIMIMIRQIIILIMINIMFIITIKVAPVAVLCGVRSGRDGSDRCIRRRQDSLQGGAGETGCSDLYDVIY